ncbi:SDR family oxidoreductase [Pontibacter flavimaris]|uniref:NAD(P)-dependent oxidoreductase n=1 Tax=Pontibacter flavimaris TaxID=1797110 RepID=A0A1Q5PA85_9BACT|nr:SDR family oxidoreductase [Pontibacter flavimaris]OKL39149.1 NAD(P)-dependent oxidoreductase [Pontibacter flavimaris]
MHTTILVTGATGTVGREVVKQLAMLDGDIRVRAGVHSIIKGENLKRLPGVEIVEMDFEDPESLRAAFTHVDKLFLITPLAEDQVQMARTLVDEAKRAGAKHIVKLSALGAGAAHGIQLGRWHHEIEQYIEESGISYTFLRPASFMQNLIEYHAESIKQEGRFYMPSGDGRISYVDARDIAAVGIEALLGDGHAGKVYDITGPEALSNTEVAQLLSEVTGRQVAFVDVPEEDYRRSLKEHGSPARITDALVELYQVQKADKSSGVTDAVEKVTNRKPHSMRQFLQDHSDCFV